MTMTPSTTATSGSRTRAGLRSPRRRRALSAASLAAAAAMALSGCGLSPSASYVPQFEEGSITPVEGAEDVPVRSRHCSRGIAAPAGLPSSRVTRTHSGGGVLPIRLDRK